MTSVMSLLLTTAAMPLITSGSAANAPRQSDDSDSRAAVNNTTRRGRTMFLELAKQPENIRQPLFDFRGPPIGLNPQGGIVDVVAGEKRGDAGVAVNKFCFVSGDKIEPQLYFEAPARFLSFNLGDGLLEQLAI